MTCNPVLSLLFSPSSSLVGDCSIAVMPTREASVVVDSCVVVVLRRPVWFPLRWRRRGRTSTGLGGCYRAVWPSACWSGAG